MDRVREDTVATPRRVIVIRECARRWREKQSQAIDQGDAIKAMHAEKCAHRFEEYLAENHDGYDAGECDESEYADSLRRLNEFLVGGKWPTI